METFGIIGMSMGTTGFIFALCALDQIKKLEKRLTESGVLPKVETANESQENA